MRNWIDSIIGIFTKPKNKKIPDTFLHNAEALLQHSLQNTTLLTPQVVLDIMLDFYGKHKLPFDVETPDFDMLLAQYAPHHSQGFFCFHILRQIADPYSEEFYQIGIILEYPIAQFQHLEHFQLWSIEVPTLAEWTEAITHSQGYRTALQHEVLGSRIEIAKT